MLQGQNIKKSYGTLSVLDGIDITIKKNEIAAIVGKSGSGKRAKFRNERIGFIFQFHHLLAEFTALENVCLPAYISGRDKATTEAKAKELLSYLGLADRLTHKPNQLSGGESQRVAIARSLINDPEIVFADEPTGNLDDHTSEDLFELLLKLRQDFNQTFVLVTHSKDIAARCDRTLTLSNKKLSNVA